MNKSRATAEEFGEFMRVRDERVRMIALAASKLSVAQTAMRDAKLHLERLEEGFSGVVTGHPNTKPETYHNVVQGLYMYEDETYLVSFVPGKGLVLQEVQT